MILKLLLYESKLLSFYVEKQFQEMSLLKNEIWFVDVMSLSKPRHVWNFRRLIALFTFFIVMPSTIFLNGFMKYIRAMFQRQKNIKHFGKFRSCIDITNNLNNNI